MSNEDPSEYENSDKEEVQKTNRDDTGVTTEDQSTGAPRIIQIPSLLTNSMRVILDAFDEDIIQLHAHGSIESTTHSLTSYVSITSCGNNPIGSGWSLITNNFREVTKHLQ